MNARWKNMTTQDRIINVSIIILSVAVIALAALQLLGIWENSINVYEPLIGVVLLLQAKLFGRRTAKSQSFSCVPQALYLFARL